MRTTRLSVLTLLVLGLACDGDEKIKGSIKRIDLKKDLGLRPKVREWSGNLWRNNFWKLVKNPLAFRNRWIGKGSKNLVWVAIQCANQISIMFAIQ